MAGRDLGQGTLVDTVRGCTVGHIGQADFTSGLLASDQAIPRIAALADDLLGILLVLAFSTEGKLVLRLSIWDLVDAEPFVGGSEKAGEVALDVFDVVQFGGQWVVDLEGFLLGSSTRRNLGFDLTSMTMIFQSVSSSSKRAMTPRTLTCLIWPV